MKGLLFVFLFYGSYNSFDPGCNEKYPKRCSNYFESDTPVCVENYSECEPFEGCTYSTKPYLCSNGVCAENFLECNEKYTTCSSSKFVKCIDGLCRESCDGIKYSACPTNQPIRCPDGSCQIMQVKCASEQCPPDEPYLCADGICKGSFHLCDFPQNIKIIQSTVLQTTNELDIYYLYDQTNRQAFSLETDKQYDIKLKGVGLSELVNTKLVYNENYDNIFNSFFQKKGNELKPYQFIRSVIFNLEFLDEINGDINEKNYVTLNIKLNHVYSNTKFDKFKNRNLYCLGVLEGNRWRCDSKNEIRFNSKFFQYHVNQSGIYAIIFNPQLENLQYTDEVYCGLICKNRRLTFLLMIIGIPSILFIMYIMFKVYQKKIQEENLTTKRIFIEKKMKEIENVNVDFAGQTILEKIEEGVQYFVNPIRNDNKEDLDEIQKLNQQLEELRMSKKESQKQKKDLIYQNKKKIEKIRKLREEIDNLEEED